ncbi:MAG: PQQ-binding-like beta-propeller repeat protein [Planctomycetaceae bacterium]|nr:PQQ-binding-like beta-propeller repeat protein [Planctomycetaceae bacterium]
MTRGNDPLPRTGTHDLPLLLSLFGLYNKVPLSVNMIRPIMSPCSYPPRSFLTIFHIRNLPLQHMWQRRLITYCFLLSTLGLSVCHELPAQVPQNITEEAQNLLEKPGIDPTKAQPGTTPATTTPSEVQESIGEQQELLRKLDTALEAFNAAEYGNAFRLIESILELDTDLLLKPELVPAFQQVQPLSIKNIALNLLENLPPEAQRIYNLQQGTAADALYQQYEQESNPRNQQELLEELLRLYPQTTSGRKAAVQLGNLYFDRSQFSTAIRYYERAIRKNPSTQPQLLFRLAWAFLQTGERERALALLNQVKMSSPDKTLSLEGKNLSLAQFSDKLLHAAQQKPTSARFPEIKNWTHSRGNLHRNVITTAAPQGAPRWQIDLLASALEARPDGLEPARKILRSLIEATATQEQELISVNEPLKIGSFLIIRTLSGMEARDNNTGELVWRYVQPDLEFQSEILEQPTPSETKLADGRTQLENLLRSKLWLDSRGQSISSNGKLVFALDMVLPDEELTQAMRVFDGDRHVERFNRLYALEAQSGKFEWEIGGTRQFQILPLAGYFFMGAPLCVEDKLYAIAISGTELLLLTIEAETGHLLLQQSLQELTRRETEELLLSNYELSPSLLDQVLLCPTGNGYLNAYDLSEKRWIWTAKYPSFSTRYQLLANSSDMIDSGYLLPSTEMNHPGGESLPVAANGHVVLAPPDSSTFFSIDVATGTLNWRREQKNLVCLIGILHQQLFVLNRTSVESIHLVTGETLWKSKLNDLPSGRPLLAGELIHIPLNSGLILSLQTESGRTLSQYVLNPHQTRGVLFASEGELFCLGEEYLISFPTRETAEEQLAIALKADAPSSETLYREAHAQLLAGHQNTGLTQLRELNNQHDSPEARRLLIRLLMEQVQFEPDEAEPAINELLSLITTADDSFSVLKLIIDRYVQRREYLLAFESTFSFIQKGMPDQLPLIKLEKTSLTPTLWFRSRITELYSRLNQSEKEIIRKRLDQILADIPADDLQQLTHLEQVFRDIPLALPLQKRLVEQTNLQIAQLREKSRTVVKADELVRLELQRNLYLQQLAFHDPEEGAEWAYLYYEHLQEAGEQELAQDCLSKIATQFESRLFHENLTGKEFAQQQQAELQKTNELRETFHGVENYDVQQYQTNTSPSSNLNKIELSHFVDQTGPFTSCRFYWNYPQHQLEIETRFQEQKWAFPFPKKTVQGRNTDRTSVYTSGPVMLLILNGELSVWISRGPDDSPTMLWNRSLNETEEESLSSHIRNRTPWYDISVPFAGPILEDRIYYRIGSTLYSAELETGRVLWQVKRVSESSLLFGNEAVLGALSSDPRMPRTITAYNAITGEVLNTITPQLGHQPIAILSNECVFSGVLNGDLTVYAQEIENGNTIWNHKFPLNSAMDVQRDEVGDRLAVLDPEGNFHLVDLTTGQKMIELKVDPIEKLEKIRLVTTDNQYLVLVEKEHDRNASFYYPQNPRSLHTPFLVNGGCFAINRQDQSLAWQQAFNGEMFYHDQINELPLMLFSIKIKENSQTFRTSQILKTMVLDRRTGKILFQHQTPAAVDSYNIVLNPEKQRIEFAFRDFTIRATPLADEPDKKETEEPPLPEDEKPTR